MEKTKVERKKQGRVTTIKLIRYMESDEYKEWFSEKIYKMFLKILKDMKKEDFTIEDAIECLEELLEG